jgi:hypothetical protein
LALTRNSAYGRPPAHDARPTDARPTDARASEGRVGGEVSQVDVRNKAVCETL